MDVPDDVVGRMDHPVRQKLVVSLVLEVQVPVCHNFGREVIISWKDSICRKDNIVDERTSGHREANGRRNPLTKQVNECLAGVNC